ncbi:hypothetical protein BVI434_1390026 [Burkholderia vietnamiensis]|nr:hypothetical protein BVI434_1390026 [Burkholderia vietnamiensis]
MARRNPLRRRAFFNRSGSRRHARLSNISILVRNFHEEADERPSLCSGLDITICLHSERRKWPFCQSKTMRYETTRSCRFSPEANVTERSAS